MQNQSQRTKAIQPNHLRWRLTFGISFPKRYVRIPKNTCTVVAILNSRGAFLISSSLRRQYVRAGLHLSRCKEPHRAVTDVCEDGQGLHHMRYIKKDKHIHYVRRPCPKGARSHVNHVKVIPFWIRNVHATNYPKILMMSLAGEHSYST